MPFWQWEGKETLVATDICEQENPLQEALIPEKIERRERKTLSLWLPHCVTRSTVSEVSLEPTPYLWKANRRMFKREQVGSF